MYSLRPGFLASLREPFGMPKYRPQGGKGAKLFTIDDSRFPIHATCLLNFEFNDCNLPHAHDHAGGNNGN